MITSYLFPPKCSSLYVLLHNLSYIQHINAKKNSISSRQLCTAVPEPSEIYCFITFVIVFENPGSSRVLKDMAQLCHDDYLTEVKHTQNGTKPNTNNLFSLTKYEAGREKNMQSVSIIHAGQSKEIKMYHYLFYSLFLP